MILGIIQISFPKSQRNFRKQISMTKSSVQRASLDEIQGGSEACDQAVQKYCAGATGASNEEVRQTCALHLKRIPRAPYLKMQMRAS